MDKRNNRWRVCLLSKYRFLFVYSTHPIGRYRRLCVQYSFAYRSLLNACDQNWVHSSGTFDGRLVISRPSLAVIKIGEVCLFRERRKSVWSDSNWVVEMCNSLIGSLNQIDKCQIGKWLECIQSSGRWVCESLWKPWTFSELLFVALSVSDLRSRKQNAMPSSSLSVNLSSIEMKPLLVVVCITRCATLNCDLNR